MDFLTSLLPPAKGYLPYYMFTVSELSISQHAIPSQAVLQVGRPPI